MKCLVQVIDVDYFLKDGKPIVRIFGRRDDGKSLCGVFEGFRPYFYTDKTAAIETKLRELGLEYEEVRRKLPTGYQANTTPVYKVVLANPQDTPRHRTTLEQLGKCYEADVLFKYRFMVDHGLKGMCWAELEGDPITTSVSKISCMKVKHIVPVTHTTQIPLRHLCIDIECLMTDLNRAPDAKRDPIIAIGMAFLPTYQKYQSLVLVAKPASINAEGARWFSGEKDLLENFLKIIEEFDPDIMTGYNINGFDFPYLVERLRKFGLSIAMGRCDKPTMCKNLAGAPSTDITGRVIADVYQILKRDTAIRLPRYNLNTAAKVLIGEEKVDIKHSEIPKVWAKDIRKFIDYTRTDALLALRLVLERRLLDKFIEIAKIAGPLLQDCLGGQTVRIETMVMHEFRERGMILSSKPSEGEATRRAEEKIKGGAVLEPVKGLHKDSILVVDFQSLYPSIIKSFNVSIDTLVLTPAEDTSVACHAAPNGARFVDASVYEGVFPTLIKRLVEARLEAKRAMKTANPEERRVLDAKQYALKILGNSFYGYCGYVRARLFRGEIANAITSYGRTNIEKTRAFVEQTFGVKVIYGDTDSLFVKIETDDLTEAQRIGENVAAMASKQMGLNLEFEKIYRSLIILTKKRYAGWRFDRKDDGWVDSLDMRGIETVRRDWCPLVGKLMLDVLGTVLKERDVAKATLMVKEVLTQLSAGQIPFEMLTIVKGVTRSLNEYAGVQPHIELAKKMQKRDPATAPKVGDRVGYIITRGKDLLSRRAEDPEYAKQNGLQLDVDYYVNSQVLPPIERIFEALGVEKSELLGAGKQISIFDTAKPQLACEDCGRAWRRLPLNGVCDCGGVIKQPA